MDTEFDPADLLSREQTITALLDNLQAKDQLLAEAHRVITEKENLITALCDRLADDMRSPVTPEFQRVIDRYRRH